MRFRNILKIILLVVAVFGYQHGYCDSHNNNDIKTIYVRGDHNYPPFEFLNEQGEPDGYNVDLIKAISSAMGFDIKIELGLWEEVRQQIEDGEIDLLMGMFNTIVRDKKVDFSIPIMISSYAVYVRNNSDIMCIEDLKGKTVILQKGDLGHDYIIERNITNKVIAKKEWTDVLLSLSQGNGDAAVVSRLQGNLFIENSNVRNIKAVGSPIIQRKYCMVVTEGNSSLLSKINEGLSIIKTSGEYDRIYHKWFGVVDGNGNVSRILKKVLIWVIVPLIILLGIGIAVSWIFKRQVNVKTKELKESETRLREIGNNLPGGMIYQIIQPQNGSRYFTYVSEGAKALHGYEAEDILNNAKLLFQQIHPDDIDRLDKEGNNLYNELKNFNTEVRFKLNSGEIRWRRLISSPRLSANNNIIIDGIELDITERKMAEQELLNYKDNLENLVKERTEELEVINEEVVATNEELFVKNNILQKTIQELKEAQSLLIQSEKMASLGILTAGVAHEINNPLNFVQNGALALQVTLKSDIPQSEEKYKTFFDAINKGTTRIAAIVKSLSRYSRSQKTSTSLCNINEILDNCLVMLHNMYKDKITLNKNYSDKLPYVIANEGELHQVFLNIIANAIQAIQEKGNVDIETYKKDCFVQIKISDDGEGIEKENLKNIFDPFYTTKEPGKGTGLGLSITKKIIEEHNGRLSCISKAGQGTTFIINLPIKTTVKYE